MTIFKYNNLIASLLPLLCIFSLQLLPRTLADTPPPSKEQLRGNFRYSYVFMTAENKRTGQRVTTCVNYQQYRTKTTSPRLVAEDFESAEPFVLGSWRDVPRLQDRTKVCPLPSAKKDYSNQIVPLDYRIDDDGTSCTQQFIVSQTSFRNATQFSVDVLKKLHAGAALLIVDRGRQFVQNWKDYLFSNFQDPTLRNDTIPTFYIYRTDFKDKIMTIANLSEIEDNMAEIRFHRPSSGAFDNSMIVIWLIAMTCVTGGGLWAFHRHRAGKDVTATPEAKTEEDSSDNSAPAKFMDRWGNSLAIVVMMVALCSVLLIGYFFRPFSVFFFNILLVLFGTSSINDCIRGLFSNFSFSKHRWYTAKMNWFPICCGRTERYSYTSFITCSLSFAFCVSWYIFRRHPYAFLPLNIINMSLCLHVLKCLRLPSLKWIFILMVCMFVYDAVMVFGTPHITKNGCSIMLEVATGITGCSTKEEEGVGGQPGYPVPPIEKQEDTPEKFPMLMQWPHMNVMNECLDMEVELGFQTSILGLGDIVMPGYLIAHCFTMNGFSERIRLSYGFVSIVGYGVGLVATFVALAIYNVAQPALIYLVPATLTPICLMALCRGEFLDLWHGVPVESLVNDEENGSPIVNDTDDPKSAIQMTRKSSDSTSHDTETTPVNV